MTNFNFLFSNSVQGESDLTRYCPRDAFEKPLTCPRHLFCKMLILSMLLMVIGVGNVWGATASISVTYNTTAYSNYETNCCTPLGTINGSINLIQRKQSEMDFYLVIISVFQRSHYLPFGHLPFGNYFFSVCSHTVSFFERLTYKTSGNLLVWITALELKLARLRALHLYSATF